MQTDRFLLPRLACSCAILLLSCFTYASSDWPMYRHDASRSGATDMELTFPLHRQWVRSYPALKPAWRDGELRFDESYQPIVAGKRLFVGSSRDDTVRALDTESGKELWVFRAEGPVRFAPVAWKESIYFVSDDGKLYCLDAATGSQRWAFRRFPLDRRVLGNERLISAFPARGAPVIKDGVLYFGVGLWPHEGTAVYALDPATGKQIWANDGVSQVLSIMPHGGVSTSGVAPQGYLFVAGDRLLVPGGMEHPACFDRRTGALLYHRASFGGKTGSWRNCAVGAHFINNASLHRVEDGRIVGGLDHPIISGGRLYSTNYRADKRIFAYEYARGEMKEYKDKRGRTRQRFAMPHTVAAGMSYRDQLQAMAGKHLLVSNKNSLRALDTSLEAPPAKATWSTTVDGRISSVIAADEKVFVVTITGNVYCFGAKKPESVQKWPPKAAEAGTDALASSAQAAELMKASGQKEGYALVLGLRDGKLVEGLLKDSNLYVIAVDTDPVRVKALRERLEGLGLYGTRAAVHIGKPSCFELPPYMANLITSEDATRIGNDGKTTGVGRLYESLRPYGGALCLQLSDAARGHWKDEIGTARLPGAQLTSIGALAILRRVGALEGCGTWSHAGCDANQTARSTDRILRGPLGVLWFNGNKFGSKSAGTRARVCGGRVFMISALKGNKSGPNTFVTAYDVYTGRTMWKQGLRIRYDKRSERTEFVALTDGLYFNINQSIVRLDPSDGRTLSTFPIPSKLEREGTQGYLAISRDLIVADPGQKIVKRGYGWGARSQIECEELVGLNRLDGKIRWTYRPDGVISYTNSGHATTMLPMRFGKECVFIQERKKSTGGKPTVFVVALDRKTGKERWRKALKAAGRMHYASKDGTLRLVGNGKKPWRMNLKEADGEAATIAAGKGGVTDPVTGRKFALRVHRQYGCNSPLRSENLILYRSASAAYYDTSINSGTVNLGGFKPSCLNNMIPADGVVSMPWMVGCACNFNMMPTLALVHLPQADMWGTHAYTRGAWGGDVKQLGINFGAPGDRVAKDGTLWLNHPSPIRPGARRKPYGSEEHRIPVSVEPAEARTFVHHTGTIDNGGLKWAAASGIEGARRIKITLRKKAAKPQSYAVQLFFAEPKRLAKGARVFDVSLQGKKVLEGFDITTAAGGPRKLVVKAFPNIEVKDTLDVELTPSQNAKGAETLICGIAVKAQQAEEQGVSVSAKAGQ